MTRLIGYIILLLFFSTPDLTANTGYFRISFTDKDLSPYSLDNPEAFLSERALERRDHAGIEPDSADLPVSPAYIDSLRSAGVNYRFNSRWFNYAIGGITDTSVYEKVKSMDFVSDVTFVKPFIHPGDIDSTDAKSPPSPLFLDPANPPGTYRTSFEQISQLNGHYLHEMGYKGKDKLIAVLDAGYTGADNLSAFSALRDEGRILANYDFIRGEADVYDDHYHGTYVLSVMAGMIKDSLTGTAPEASYLLLRSEDARTEYRIEEHSWIAAAEFADSAGADIINSSLGYTTFDSTSMNYEQQDLDGKTTWVSRGAALAAEKGILVTNSAGNSRGGPWGTLVAPADARNILAVAAVDRNKDLAPFSSPGYTADGRISPTVTAMGQDVTLVSSLSDKHIFHESGTSFSSPLIAGMAACLWQAYPELTNTELRTLIIENGHLANNPNPDMGYGIPNFTQAYKRQKNERADTDFEVLKAYPNPFYRKIVLETYSEPGASLTVTMTDNAGRRILKEEWELEENKYREVIIDNLTDLQGGLYHLQLRSNHNIWNKKFIKP